MTAEPTKQNLCYYDANDGKYKCRGAFIGRYESCQYYEPFGSSFTCSSYSHFKFGQFCNDARARRECDAVRAKPTNPPPTIGVTPMDPPEPTPDATMPTAAMDAHNAAMELADHARRLFAEAAEKEAGALLALPADAKGTRSIFSVSLANLLFKSGQIQNFEEMISDMLAVGDLAPWAEKELRRLRAFLNTPPPKSPPTPVENSHYLDLVDLLAPPIPSKPACFGFTPCEHNNCPPETQRACEIERRPT